MNRHIPFNPTLSDIRFSFNVISKGVTTTYSVDHQTWPTTHSHNGRNHVFDETSPIRLESIRHAGEDLGLMDPGPRSEAETEVWKARHLIGKERQEDKDEEERDKPGSSAQRGGESTSRPLASTSTSTSGLSEVQKGKRPASPDPIGTQDKKQKTMEKYGSPDSFTEASLRWYLDGHPLPPTPRPRPQSPRSTPFPFGFGGKGPFSETQSSQQSTPRKTAKERRSLLIRDNAGSEYRFNVTATDTGHKVARGLARLGNFPMDRMEFQIGNFGYWSMNKTVNDVELWALLDSGEDLQPDVTVVIHDVSVLIFANSWRVDTDGTGMIQVDSIPDAIIGRSSRCLEAKTGYTQVLQSPTLQEVSQDNISSSLDAHTTIDLYGPRDNCIAYATYKSWVALVTIESGAILKATRSPHIANFFGPG